MEKLINGYSNRYYALYDTAAQQPTPITGWIDVALFSEKPDWLPEESDLLALTDNEWSARQSGGKGVNSGKIVSYAASTPVTPLKTQASIALTSARSYVYNNYGILNEDTPEDWVAYIKELMAIANGSDTTSTDLPTAPTTTDAATRSTPTASTTTPTTSTATTTS